MTRASLQIEATGVSHLGKVRQVNQDGYFIAALEPSVRLIETNLPDLGETEPDLDPRVLVIADGVGGSSRGEEASSRALSSLVDFLGRRDHVELDGPEAARILSDAIRSSHSFLRDEAVRVPELTGMATTMTMAMVRNHALDISHVGDSRCYLVRRRPRLELLKVTKDQTIAQHLIDEGVLDAESAARSSFSQVLADAVGMDGDTPEVLSYEIRVDPDDLVLLCTDGLTKHVDDQQILEHLSDIDSLADLERARDELLESALGDGGTDNVTIVLARVVSPPRARTEVGQA